MIQALINGENAAAIFPTGGVKSLCYQLPGLMLTSEGLTLVVSPLLALMKDQVNSMKALGHPVDLLASILALDEKIAVKHRVRNGYVAPEQLNNENTLALIQSVSISLLAIARPHAYIRRTHFSRVAPFGTYERSSEFDEGPRPSSGSID